MHVTDHKHKQAPLDFIVVLRWLGVRKGVVSGDDGIEMYLSGFGDLSIANDKVL